MSSADLGGRHPDPNRPVRFPHPIHCSIVFVVPFTFGYVVCRLVEEVPIHRVCLSTFTIVRGSLLGGTIPSIPNLFIPELHIVPIYSSIFMV
jgi:hypothetical protein